MSEATLGYMIVIRENGGLVADWDGEIHSTMEDVTAELAKAREVGYDAFIAQLVGVSA